MTEFGDFSHHRPVLLAQDTAPPVSATNAEALAAVGAATAERYFDLGYPGIAWKITEGLDYEDPTWRGAYVTAVRRGRWFLGYHFDRAANDGAAQFDWFLSRFLAGAGGHLRSGGMDRLCLDSEDTQTPTRARASAVAFTDRAVTRGYPAGCVYSALFFDSWTRPATVRLDLLPAGWQVGWLADYTAGELDGHIGLPDGWGRGQVWARQYTSTKPGLPGLPMGCDFNRILRPWPAGEQEDAMPTAAELWDVPIGWPDNLADVPPLPHAKGSYTAKEWLTGASINAARAVREAQQAQDAVTRLAGVVASLQNDEAKILAGDAANAAKVLAAGDANAARILAAVQAVIVTPGVDHTDPDAFVAALRDALVRGEPPAAP